MIIVWRGLGILVPILTLVILFLAQTAFDAVFGAGFYSNHGLPKLLSLWAAGAFIWLFGVALDNSHHSLFWIPVKYWGLILFFIGLAALTF